MAVSPQRAPLQPLRSPWTQLTSHARERGADTAIFDVQGETVVARTWTDVTQRVERAAAGLLRAGFRPQQVAIVLLEPSADAVEVELALRAVGAVPLYIAPDVTPEELAPHLVGVDVRLVVADHEERSDSLRGCNGSDAEHLLLGGTRNWERLQEVGTSHLHEIPHSVRQADEIADPVKTIPMLVLREDNAVVVRRMPNAGSERPAETVLLHGPLWDPHAAAVRATQLASGGALAWTGDVSQLPLLLQRVSPTMLATLAGEEAEVATLLRDAHVNGRPWHKSSADVLASVAAVASEGRIGPGVRRRAHSIESLAPWFGPRLRAVMLNSEQDPVLNAVARALSLQVLPPAPLTLQPATLPRAPAKRRLTDAELPRRNRSQPHKAFRAVRGASPAPSTQQPEPEAERETEGDSSSSAALPSMSLFGGESVLDRLLASQAAEKQVGSTSSTA